MLKIYWDVSINGILISESGDSNEQIAPPRPIFFEELNVLGFHNRFSYPESDEPILWAIDRRYYYRGVLVAEVSGGSIYNNPTVHYSENCKYNFFEKMDLDLIIKKNSDALYTLENEAMDFIKDTYSKYSKKVDSFVVAFSGGKDSQVILDLVSRVIPPKEYKIVFTDTGMEIPWTYLTVEKTREQFVSRFNGVEFIVAKSDKNATTLWKRYGPPSRINRWCCSVLKTSLFSRTMRDALGTQNQPRLVVFEGVRSDESVKRESYNRIGEGVKHVNLINSRAIFRWNLTEIYLYILYRKIDINPAYRYGFSRVGCSICPFASDWSEFLIRKLFPELTKEYVMIIEQMAKNIGIKSKDKIDQYIDRGNWKKNAGGKGLELDDSRIDVITKDPSFEVILSKPKTDLVNWLKIIGKFIIVDKEVMIRQGELYVNDEIYYFTIQNIDEKVIFKVFNTNNKVTLTSALYKISNKTTYCEKCGICEAECPTGALRVYPEPFIDSTVCVHCKNCLSLNNKGCLIAERRAVSEGVTKMSLKSSGIDKYSTFGFREHWLANFFTEMDNWFVDNHGLGTKQVPAMINWLRESELLKLNEKRVTELARILKHVYYKNPLLVWQIIWVNLYFNSMIVKWYVENVKNNTTYTKNELTAYLIESFPVFSEGTLNNPLSALINTFGESSLGSQLKIGVIEKRGKIKSITKSGGNLCSPITICYFLYKLSESRKNFEWSVLDFYGKGEIGPFELFGINSEYFINSLRMLQEQGKNLVNVDLLDGLDNIHLIDGVSGYDVLKILLDE